MSNLTPVIGGHTIGKGMLYARSRDGSNIVFAEIGDMDEFSLGSELERARRQSNQTATAKTTFSAVTGEQLMGKFTLYTLNRDGRAMAVAASKADLEQSASTGDTMELTDPQVGNIYDLDGFDITITDFEDDSMVAFVAGTHYELDTEAGLVKILALPAGVGSGVTITYDKAAITGTAARNQLALFSNFDQEFELIFRGTNRYGAKVHTRLHKCQLNPAGPRQYISGTDLISQEIEVEVLADLTQPAGQEYGLETDLA
ncbi:MAG: hypothetical protein Alpg2KO_00880 [Alphaproteobacteria bacterium]